VSLETALAAATVNGAFLMHQESDTGSLVAGKAADLVVLDRDLFAIAPAGISDAKVLATYLDGELVYGE
jgi:predicted amidohydrolase YtcJ